MNSGHDALTKHMARRSMRLAHLVWHTAREKWLFLPGYAQNRLSELNPAWWPVPNPSLGPAGRIIGQGAGIDFLGAHRQMLKMAKDLSGENDESLVPWHSPPSASDPLFVAPRNPNVPSSIRRAKDDSVWDAIVSSAETLISGESLRRLTIDELGTHIEFGIHAAMHERFGDYAGPGLRPNVPVIESKWDQPAYNSLLDPYSAHVHPWFWKIHGWIDGLIDRWEHARNTTAPGLLLAWMGPMDHGTSHADDARLVAELEVCMRLLYQPWRVRPHSSDTPSSVAAAARIEDVLASNSDHHPMHRQIPSPPEPARPAATATHP